jgi:GT2 family glycosyltransferase
MTVSIIIAVKTWQKNLEECVERCLRLDFPDFEILILPDSDDGTHPLSSKMKIIPTGAITPPKKRDMGLVHARGEIIAFLDDDAYPVRGWLKNAVKNFQDEEVAAVGGPAVTPADDDLRQKASGIIYASWLTSGRFVYRYVPRGKRLVDDYPSCNLLVRGSILRKAGGFNTDFWPGEDTKLCLEITKVLGKKIVYDPEVLVYHHRRRLFLPHLKQVANYSLHRGYFVKRHPETSRKFVFFIPSIFVAVLLSGLILSLFSHFVKIAYFFGIVTYLTIVLIASIINGLRLHQEETKPRKAILMGFVFAGTILTHVVYGIYFIKGLFSRKLKEEA